MKLYIGMCFLKFFSVIICRYDIAVHINSKMLMRDVTPYYQYIYK